MGYEAFLNTWIAFGYLNAFTMVFLAFLAIVLAFVGTVWSPFAALWRARIAQSNGLSARSYAVRGGVYSALFFLPRVYLTMWMADKSAARAVGTGAYALLYTIWFVVMMYLIGIAAIFQPDGSPYPEHYRQTLFGFDWQWIVQLIETSLLILSVYLWVSSLRKLRRRSKGEGRSEVAPQCATLPDWAYLTPLWYGILNTAIGLLVARIIDDLTFRYKFFM